VLPTAKVGLRVLVLVTLTTVLAWASVPKRAQAAAPGPVTYLESPQFTHGFDVFNLTGTALTLAAVQGHACTLGNCRDSSSVISSAPSIGSVLEPGQFQHFEVSWLFGADGLAYVRYSNGASFYLLSHDGDGSEIPDDYFGFHHLRNCSGGDFNNGTVTFLDPPGIVHDIPPGQGQEQAQVLKEFCATNSKARWRGNR
jgi:hypothetical protein